MGDSVLVLLRDEFADNDVLSKRRASERLDVVAKALGPEKARSELLPWLKENLEQQEDEVLFVFAKKCSELISLIGGPEYADSLWPILEHLLEVDETFVREAAVDCARVLIKDLKKDDIKSKICEAIQRMAKNEWFTSRMSACALCGPILSNGVSNPEEVKQLKETFYVLCKDETPMVRRYAAKELQSVLGGYSDANEVVNDILPIFEKMSVDPQESVAMNWIANIGPIAEKLTPELCASHIFEHVKQFVGHRSWRVRYTVAQCFGKLCTSAGEAGTTQTLLPLFCELFRDAEPEVRNAVSVHLDTICSIVPANAYVENVLPVSIGLIEMDQQRTVRLNIARHCVGTVLLGKLDEGNIKANVLPIWELLLKDSEAVAAAESRLIVLEGLEQIGKKVGESFVAKAWAPLFQELFESSKHHNGGQNDPMMNPNNPGMGGEEIEHPQWRLRVSILEGLSKLANSGDPAIDKLIVDLWYTSLSDCVFEVRQTAANLLGKFCEPDSPVGKNKVASLYVPKLLDFFKQAKGKYSQRIVFVQAFASLVKRQALVEAMYPAFEKCLEDRVPNVRLVAVQAFAGCDDGALLERFSKHLNALSNDPDPDVSNEAKLIVGRMLA